MATVIAFTSGKEGVGKTNIATNLAIALAVRNVNVCLFSTVPGAKNVNLLTGIHPVFNFEQVLSGQKKVENITLPVPFGISIVPSTAGLKKSTELNFQQLAILTSSFKQLEKKYDFILVDTMAEAEGGSSDFILSAHYRVIVITSEPRSLTKAFDMLRWLIAKKNTESTYILVNRVKDYQASMDVFQCFQKSVKAYLKIDIHYLGYLPDDEHVKQAVSQQIPVVISYPSSAISCGLSALADVVKRQCHSENKLSFISRYMDAYTINQKLQINDNSVKEKLNREGEKDDLEITLKPENLDRKSAEIYDFLEKLQLPADNLKELIFTLENVYQKKYKKPIREIESILNNILLKKSADSIKDLYTSIERSYKQRFGEEIKNSSIDFYALLKSEQFSRKKFEQLIKKIAKIYQERFNEEYSE